MHGKLRELIIARMTSLTKLIILSTSLIIEIITDNNERVLNKDLQSETSLRLDEPKF